MKKSTKRILSAVMTVVLLLSCVVPAVFADATIQTFKLFGDANGPLTIYLDGETNGSKGAAYKPFKANAEKVISDWTYLNQSDPANEILIHKKSTKYMVAEFNEEDAENGDWFAIRINVAAASTYDMTFGMGYGTKGGFTKVYVMDCDVYAAAIQGYTLGTTAESALTKEQNDAIYEALEGKTLAEGVLDSNKGVLNNQSIGCVEFAEAGNYVLLFRCLGKNEDAKGCNFIPSSISLTPVVATVKGVGYITLAAAVAAAGNEGGTVTLLDDMNENVDLSAGVILDLNGKTLTADTVVTADGSNIVDSSADDTGLLKIKNPNEWTASAANKELAVYDAVAGGYRFYEVTEADRTAAATVQKKIDGLTNVTLETESVVTEARAAYEALNALQKALVDTAKLTAAEAKLVELKKEAEQAAADQAAADAVTAKIEAIGTVTLESDAAIKAARTAYEALTDAQKALVNTDKLTAAEAKLAELIKEAEKDEANKAAADAVTAKIEAIGTVTLESETAITAARTAYEALTNVQKLLVNTDKLTAAETKLAELKKAAEEKAAADKAAADAVIAQINAIGSVTKESKAAIEAVRTAYDALTEDQKALVTNLNTLKAAEDAYAELIKDPSNPNTGDSMPLVLLTCMLVVSMAALTALTTCSIRKKYV